MTHAELIIATRNAHKAKEIAALLPGYCIRSLSDFPNLPDVPETGHTFAENAALKALAVSTSVPGMVLADDSGLCVDALSGMPGIFSARYAGVHGDDAANNEKLLGELAALPSQAPFRAHFACAMCLARNSQVLGEFMGILHGSISLTPCGSGGFGYDPLFIPDGFASTLAELSPEQKNSISHRAKALEQVVTFLRTAHRE